MESPEGYNPNITMRRRGGRPEDPALPLPPPTMSAEEMAAENRALKEENAQLHAALARENESQRGSRRRKHIRDSMMHVVCDSTAEPGARGSVGVDVRNANLSRQASVGTSNVLRSLPNTSSASSYGDLPTRVIGCFKNVLSSVSYLSSEAFGRDLLLLSTHAQALFEAEERCLKLESPIYVFGDTHGNLEDLHFFADNIWKLGMPLTAGRFLFLGDYVDRGLSGLEVIAYLLALKLLCPSKIYLLRGNHETRDVNGWEDHYQEKSFLFQCKDRFGVDLGEQVWEAVNCVFDRLPLACVIDDEIFCVHGGIPRRPPSAPPTENRINLLEQVPNVSAINPPNALEADEMQQFASECVWSDPACEEQEPTLDTRGYGESFRGGGTICFGNQAISDFLAENKLRFIIRAHEAHAYGVSLSKMARVFTVFSTSKDHHQGKNAQCGCILIDVDRIQVITRSTHYKNRYVHRRDSLSLEGLDEASMDFRERAGLIVDEEDEEGLARKKINPLIERFFAKMSLGWRPTHQPRTAEVPVEADSEAGVPPCCELPLVHEEKKGERRGKEERDLESEKQVGIIAINPPLDLPQVVTDPVNDDPASKGCLPALPC